MVILLFLRNFWATFIPGVTVPLALLGSFAAMYLLNFSLDNLSLMALTIAVGFVVDDAIVVVENIYRHVENGEPPFEAALKGSREIGFTVLSISLLADRGVHSAAADGRHHRPPVPRIRPDGHRLDRGLGAGLADARADAVLALHAARVGRARPRLPHHRSAASTPCCRFYRRTLDVVLRHQAITLGVFFATMALTVVMAIYIPKGFFPIQDIGLITRRFARRRRTSRPRR